MTPVDTHPDTFDGAGQGITSAWYGGTEYKHWMSLAMWLMGTAGYVAVYNHCCVIYDYAIEKVGE